MYTPLKSTYGSSSSTPFGFSLEAQLGESIYTSPCTSAGVFGDHVAAGLLSQSTHIEFYEDDITSLYPIDSDHQLSRSGADEGIFTFMIGPLARGPT
ncbi:MAG: hypothetical protein KTR29_16495 [Rhodothermaceae bacterium]|nr:hypothetical protein [Rhodothermaceae bacterium]